MLDTAEQTSRISYEHLHCYALYREYVEGKRVLDIVDGAIYGTYLLSERATSVTVVSTDKDVIADAEKQHSGQNIHFLFTDLVDLPFDDSHFDVVICNDIMALTQDQKGLIIELKRVLKEEGLFITASSDVPTRDGQADVELPGNRASDPAPFRKILNRHFSHVQLTGLRQGRVSLSFRLDQHKRRTNRPSALTFLGDFKDGVPVVQGDEIASKQPDRIIALCSMQSSPAEETGASLFMPRDETRWLDHIGNNPMEMPASGQDDPVLRVELSNAQALLQTLRDDLNKALEDRAQLEARYNQLSIDAASTVTFSRLLARMTGTMVATDADSIVEKLFGLNQLIATQRSQLESTQEMADTLATAERTTTTLREQLAETQLRLVNVNAMLDQEQREAVSLRAKLDVAEKAAAVHQAQLSQVGSQLMDANSQLGRERGEAEGLRAQVSGFNHIVAAQRDQLDLVREDAASRQKQVIEVSSELAVANALLGQERNEVLNIRSRLEESNQALTDTRTLLELEQAEAREIQDRFSRANEALAALRDQLETAKGFEARLATVEEYAAATNAQLTQAQKELTDTLGLLELERQKSQRDMAVLRKQLAVATAGLERAQQEAEQAKALRIEIAEPTTQPAPPPSAGVGMATLPARAAPNTSVARTVSRQNAGVRRELERFVQVHGNIRQQIVAAAQDVRAHIVHQPRPVVQESVVKRLSRRFDRDAAPFRTKLFDSHWLATQSADAAGVRLGRYLRDPGLWTLDPHPLFASSYYLQKNPDVASEGVCPLRHYLEMGWREGRNPHPYFLNDWYLNQNKDLLPTLAISPLEHYLEHGWREGRAPNPLFNPQTYLNRYPDVAQAGIEPLTHYIVYGRAEKREIPLTSVNPAWESLLTGTDRSLGLLDFMLDNPPLPLPADEVTPEASAVIAQKWPPERLNDFWIPQKLRDFLVEGRHESEIDLYTYLCSVMAAYQEKPETFPASSHCLQISDRIKALSAARVAGLPDQPDASIIIPVYNNVIDTLLCICSVLEYRASASYEIIVADDGSSDATPQLIATLGGVVRYLRQPRNYGFVGNCNEAAKQARGRHVVLLNNDTLVMPYWLDTLLDTFEMHDGVGLAGSKLINWDGTLQEAGGIYWNDGSAWNFGRGANARAAEFNYLKDVDYISGAAIAIPTDVWRAMGGFDEIYAPAYCEDSDLAFRLREAGYRTVLNPASEVLHHEGRSHGRDLNSGIKAYQVKNQETFLDRWRPVLARDHFPNAQNVLRARDRSFGKKHVLVIDHYVPQWDRDAGSRSTFMSIKALLAQGYAVTFWPDNLWRDPQYTPTLQEMGVEVIYGTEYRDKFGEFLQARSNLYDAVFVNRPHIAPHYLKTIRATNGAIKIIYYGHDLHFRRLMTAQSAGEPVSDVDIRLMRSQELDVCSQADVILYPDQTEVDLVERELGGDRTYKALPVYAFEKGMFARSGRVLNSIAQKRAFNLLFVGGFNHTPNADGIIWFVQNILPIVQERLGKVQLTIVGSNAPESVLALESDGVEVAGFVSDDRLSTLYEETSLVIAPLRFGGGVKGKVIEAMASGVPLVTTPIGAQGLQDPEALMFLASETDAFADAVIQALTDRDEAATRARNAWAYTNRHYSMQAMENLFNSIVG
ncbi:glycosyltransferase [Sphingobium indicum]|uniref:glycosyltransferase n=1 Tax=Sphingobium indicum TaxID=332055 RepID=UPI000686B57A|nr:glycosyltransferase [Sphingobium indicum]